MTSCIIRSISYDRINVENHEIRRRLLNHLSIGEGEIDICVIYSGYKYKRISIKKVVVRCRLRF